MPTVQRNPDGDDQAAATMQLIAREALAAVPAEPEHDPADDTTEVPCGMCRATGVDQQGATASATGVACPWCEGTKTILALGCWVRPAEPEAWEWRAVHCKGTPWKMPVFTTREQAERQIAVWPRWAQGRLERRRALGPWERVDPEPRPQDGGEQ